MTSLVISDRWGREMTLAQPRRSPTMVDHLDHAVAYAHVAARLAASSLEGVDLAKMGSANRAAQERAYRHHAEVGEVFNATRSVASLVSSVPLLAQQTMRQIRPDGRPGPVIEEASEVEAAHDWVAAFGLDDGGQPELMRRFAEELFIGGEVAVLGWTDADGAGHWAVAAPMALDDRSAPGSVLIGDGSRDPIKVPRAGSIASHVVAGLPGRRRSLPFSGVMAADIVCQTIVALDRLLDVIAKVNLSPGLLLIPSEVEPPPVSNTMHGFDTDAPSRIGWFAEQLDRAILDAVTNPQTSAELVPTPVIMAGDQISNVRHLLFERKYDERVLEVRKWLADLLLTFLDVEARAVDGSLVESKYVNGSLVRESLLATYVRPYAARAAEVATDLLQAWLATVGIDPSNQIVSPDFSALEPPPDSATVLQAFQLGAIGAHGVRQFLRLPEEWAPEVVAQDAPPEPAMAPGAQDSSQTADQPQPDVVPAVAAAVATQTDAKRAAAIAAALALINRTDQRVAARIDALAASAIADAARAVVRRADQAKARSRDAAAIAAPLTVSVLGGLGVDVDELIARATSEQVSILGRQLSKAQRAILDAVAELDGGEEPSQEELDALVAAATAAFSGQVRAAVLARLSEVSDDTELDIASIEAPTGTARAIANLAGGSSGILASVAGLLGSRLVTDGLASAGVVTEFEWQHSGNPNDFPPHLDLDGVTFSGWDDPAISSAGTGWEWVGDAFSPTNGPDGPDHDGCGCEAVLVSGAER